MTDSEKQEQLRIAFARVFGTTDRSIEQRIVWAWLVKFCRARQSTYEENERHHALREGRREVFLEIERRLQDPEPTVDDILRNVIGDHNDD